MTVGGGLLTLGRDAPAEAVAVLADHVKPGERAGYADPDMSPCDLAEPLIRTGEVDTAFIESDPHAPLAPLVSATASTKCERLVRRLPRHLLAREASISRRKSSSAWQRWL